MGTALEKSSVEGRCLSPRILQRLRCLRRHLMRLRCVSGVSHGKMWYGWRSERVPQEAFSKQAACLCFNPSSPPGCSGETGGFLEQGSSLQRGAVRNSKESVRKTLLRSRLGWGPGRTVYTSGKCSPGGQTAHLTLSLAFEAAISCLPSARPLHGGDRGRTEAALPLGPGPMEIFQVHT